MTAGLPIARRISLLTGVLAFLFPASAVAQVQDGGSIRGTVVNATGQYTMADALVTLVGRDRQAVSNRSGRFRFDNVPPGEYTVRATYVGGETSESTVVVEPGATSNVELRILQSESRAMDEILVRGQAAGQAAGLNRRRQDESIIDVLSSDSAGQFPDQNLAEALQRASGVSIQRDQGEGRFVVIRGIDPRFNSTTVNGLRIPGPEADSRAVNLDVISSDLIETVEISKAVTPDMDGDAVGGNVEIKTITAFDLPERFIKFSLGGSYNSTNEKTSPDVSGTYADVFSIGSDTDNVGIAFSFSKFDRDTVTDGIEADPWEFLDAPGGGEFRSPDEGQQRDYILTRKRTSLALNFDYRPTDNTELFLRTLYSEFDDAETKLENVYKFPDGDVATLDGTSGTFTGAEMEKANSDSNKVQEILSISTGGETILRNGLLDYSIGYSVAGEEGVVPEVGGVFVAEGVEIGYDAADAERPLMFGFGAQAILDPTSFELAELTTEDFLNEERELALTINFRRDVMFGDKPGYIKLGAKSRLREKENNIDAVLYEDFGASFTMADFTLVDYDFPLPGELGPAIDFAEFRSFYQNNRGSFTQNDEDTAIDSQAEDYTLEEDIHAAYIMAGVDIGKLHLIGGLRAEYTDYSAIGTRVSIDEQTGDGNPVLEPFVGEKDYTDLFPGITARYLLSERSQLRFALTRTISRPGFEDASPRQALEITDEGGGVFERVAEIGNPDLEPLSSNNLDFRWEFYPSGISSISAGVFYKDIDNFFVTADTAGEPPFENFDEVIQTINGSEGELWGIELEYVRQFGNLPAPWDGLLIGANYTFTDSEASLPDRATKISLPGQSDHIGNLSLGYDNGTLSLRLAAAYRSEFFEEVNDVEDPALDRYQNDHLQIDFTAKYWATNSLQVYFNAININDEPFRAYFDRARFLSQYEEYGPTFEAGVSMQF